MHPESPRPGGGWTGRPGEDGEDPPAVQWKTEPARGPMDDLLRALLVYKSVFLGPWFKALSEQEDAPTQAAYERIMHQTAEEAEQTADLVARWNAHPSGPPRTEVAQRVLKKALEDVLALKKGSTEAFLQAGLGAPTEEMRQAFLKLADLDRRHAETLREALGIHRPRLPRPATRSEPGHCPGIQTGPFRAGALSTRIADAIGCLQAEGHKPARVLMSPLTLRRLRDEGTIPPDEGSAFGLPAEVEPSWAGECFAILSLDCLSLAEIATELAASGTCPEPVG